MNGYRPIGICGYPGSGKTVLSNELSGRGFQVFSGSGIIISEAKKVGYQSDGSRDGYMELWYSVASKRGNDWLVSAAAETSGVSPFVFDGLRIIDDAKRLQQMGGLLVYLHQDPLSTIEKIRCRGRGDDIGLENVADLQVRYEVEDNGEPFSQAAIRDMCEISILPVPYLDSSEDVDYYFAKIADSLLEVSAEPLV